MEVKNCSRLIILIFDNEKCWYKKALIQAGVESEHALTLSCF